MGCSANKQSTVDHGQKWARQEQLFKQKYGTPRPQIEHVVVLMLENRTFDNIFGSMIDKRMNSGEIKPSRWDTTGQAGKGLYDYSNDVIRQDGGGPVSFPVWSATEDIMSDKALSVPSNDPPEDFFLLNLGVYEKRVVQQGDVPTMGGFAQQFYEKESALKKTITTDFDAKRSPAMHVFLPEQVNVFTELGTSFGVSDTYFSSAPCQTWPNRLFAQTGTCYGYVNNMFDRPAAKPYEEDPLTAQAESTAARVPQFTAPTVFTRLQESGVEWALYHGGFPLTLLNEKMRSVDTWERTYLQEDFAAHCKSGDLPPFTWIEPRYVGLPADLGPPTDMHPPYGVAGAQSLVADIYNALRGNEELWSKTLFLVNCDEGVGIFDHVPPPAAADPDAGTDHEFFGQAAPSEMEENPFLRYGTRTPLLVASPFVDPGAVLRPVDDSKYPFDHASVLRTVFDLFVGPDCHLTARDKAAPSFAPILRQTPRSELGPTVVKPSKEPPSFSDWIEAAAAQVEQETCHAAGMLHGFFSSSMAYVMAPLKKASVPGRPSHVAKK